MSEGAVSAKRDWGFREDRITVSAIKVAADPSSRTATSLTRSGERPFCVQSDLLVLRCSDGVESGAAEALNRGVFE